MKKRVLGLFGLIAVVFLTWSHFAVPTYAYLWGNSDEAEYAIFVSGSYHSVPAVTHRDLADAAPWVRALKTRMSMRIPESMRDAPFINGVVVFFDRNERCLGMRPVSVPLSGIGVDYMSFFVYGRGEEGAEGFTPFRRSEIDEVRKALDFPLPE